MDMFGHQSSVSPRSSGLVQALVITYDEIFQALAVDTNRRPRIFFFSLPNTWKSEASKPGLCVGGSSPIATSSSEARMARQLNYC
jgi:hypothetical protein